MAAGMQTIIYPVKHLDAAKAVYRTLLGAEPYVDQPYYVGFRVDGQEVGLDPHGHDKGMAGPVGYTHVGDIHQRFRSLLEAGATEHEGVHDVGGGRLIASVTDPDGNVVGLLQDA